MSSLQDNIDRPFHLEVNGRFVVDPNVNDDGPEGGVKLGQPGDISHAVVFSMKDGLLQYKDWFMGKPTGMQPPMIPVPATWAKSTEGLERMVAAPSPEGLGLEVHRTVFGTMDRIMNVVVVMDPGVLASEGGRQLRLKFVE